MRTKWSSFIVVFVLFLEIASVSSVFAQSSNPVISSISDNRSSYSSSQIPMYEKFEITFQVQTNAQNLQLPFDNAPPPGVTPGQGISVNAVFTDPSGATFTQPAFYYQYFEEDSSKPFSVPVKDNEDWIYPKNQFAWKVRFSPNKPGVWKYKLTAQDSSGSVVSPESTVQVVSTSNHGFVRVSKKDSRYFEYEDGTYFPGLGYNSNFDRISWISPISRNNQNFSIMKQNGIQLIRMWLTQWPIFTTSGVGFTSIHRGMDYKSIINSDSRVPLFIPAPGSEYAMWLQTGWNPSMMWGWGNQALRVKPNTKYHIAIRYLIPQLLGGPLVAGKPFGLCAKIADWEENIANSGTGTVVSQYATVSPRDANGKPQWATLEGSFTTGNQNNLRNNFYLTIENTINDFPNVGIFAYIDKVSVEEDLGNGSYGPNIIPLPWMARHLYMSQDTSYRFDKVLELAHQNNVYLKTVLLEKNEYIMNTIDYAGKFTAPDCNQPPPTGVNCPSNNWFYGNWGAMTKVKWLQQAWWRYAQARWGYSPNIHSWELLNEGDPYNGLHYSLANEFAKYMHQFSPNQHLVTTSMWNSYPISGFWKNSGYQDLDYTDIHHYMTEGQPIDVRVDSPTDGTMVHVADGIDFYDSALEVQKLSMILGGKQSYGVNKPIMRGETGFVINNSDGWNHGYFTKDTNGVWLHNYIWAQINPGGLIESYWYDTEHIYPSGRDLRPQFKPYGDFITAIPLSNGNYVDAAPVVAGSTNVRAWGQKDTVNKRAHLWIQNTKHTWCAVVNAVTAGTIPSCPVSWDNSALTGTVTLAGFAPNASYPVEWWNFDYNTVLTKQITTVTANSSGQIVLTLSSLSATVTDTAVKIGDYTQSVPTATPTVSCGLPGDLNCSGKVDSADLLILLGNFGKSGVGDINNSGKVDTADLLQLLSNFGK